MQVDGESKQLKILSTREEVLDEVRNVLTQTVNTVDPAAKANEERKRVAKVTTAAVKLNIILASVLLVSVSANCVFGWFAIHRERQYFAADNGRYTQLVPLNRPYRKVSGIIQYAKDTINRSFSLDFLNWRQQLEDVRPLYTKSGFKQYLDALEKGKYIKYLEKDLMNITITSSTGVVSKEGLVNGVYVWIIEIPIEVKVAGQSKQLTPQKFVAHVRVERVSTLESVGGISVGQIITKPK
ncbi:DotI/IcmL family type IV secretion protein [Zooshikella marina]|uniref:DotI/IcmL family type IV secretion protein n=1 Tax=Zooshikella ganghwensis TaxID=202772 RepID=UPI001BB077D4|nr:DotI/IcmL family type IV secretion protein [Zooshikella ganghwensis]MBU2708741.1 DotI/IcmL family type IV secretion protein [Zooshikella ganghwensis]